MKNPVEQARNVVGLAGHLGRGIGRVTTDAVVGGRAGLPRTAEAIDAALLSKVIGSTVYSVTVLDSDAGTSSRARLALTGNDVPQTVFVKITAQTAATRLMGELGRLGDTEVHFYSQLAPELDGVPKAFGRAFDTWTGRYLLILEDLPAHSCNFPTPCTRFPSTKRVLSSNCSPCCTPPSGTAFPTTGGGRWDGSTLHRVTSPRC